MLIDSFPVQVADAKTEKGSAAFTTSGDARLDLFFSGLVRGAGEDKLRAQMAASWK